ncbi:MAG: rubrerythrin family protein [Oscillospiraceae bacterium]|nr:rubrerythrin family protein [Oscillospiraceae bacterium]
MELKDSVTRENLLRAFAGESQARNRYTFAAGLCCENKLQVLEKIFLYTAGQEKEHAEIFYNHLVKGGCDNITITANYPIDVTQQPLKLLELARQHELDEFGDVYPAFAEKAQEEGFTEIARHFKQIAQIEKVHADRFERFAKLLRENKLFVSDVETGWMCLNCGHVFTASKVPAKCPVCDHDQGFFIRFELSPYER